MNQPNLPDLPIRKSNRAITKHFTNLSLFLPQDRLALFTWLIYQSNADNTFIWDGHLLDKYRMSVKYAVEEYGGVGVGITPQKVRADYRWLKQNNYILSINKTDLINPMFSYCLSYKAKHKEFSKGWQSKSIKELVEAWIK